MIFKGRNTSRLEYCIEDPTYQGAKMYAQGEDNERLSSRPVPARTSERGFSLWAVKFKRKSYRRPLQRARMVHGSSVTTYANEPIILGRVNPWQPLVRGITSEV